MSSMFQFKYFDTDIDTANAGAKPYAVGYTFKNEQAEIIFVTTRVKELFYPRVIISHSDKKLIDWQTDKERLTIYDPPNGDAYTYLTCFVDHYNIPYTYCINEQAWCYKGNPLPGSKFWRSITIKGVSFLPCNDKDDYPLLGASKISVTSSPVNLLEVI